MANARRLQTRAARSELDRSNGLLQSARHLFVRVGIGRADIDHECARVWNDVVSRAAVDNRRCHFDRPQGLRFALKLVVAQGLYCVQCAVQFIHALISFRMTRLAECRSVEHHQSLFGHSNAHTASYIRVHTRRLAHQRNVDFGQLADDT